jgi:hypothetical protein
MNVCAFALERAFRGSIGSVWGTCHPYQSPQRRRMSPGAKKIGFETIPKKLSPITIPMKPKCVAPTGEIGNFEALLQESQANT